MKKHTLIALVTLFTTNLFAVEIVCLPESLTAPFDKVSLIKLKGNKFKLEVEKNNEQLYVGKVGYFYSRRKRVGIFRNSKEEIEIKTLKLRTNAVTKSLLKVSPVSKEAYAGVCKQYSQK